MKAFLGLSVALALTSAASASIAIVPSATAFIDISGTGTSVGSISDDSESVVAGATLGFAGNELLAGGMSIRVGNNGAVLWGNSATDTFTNATDVGYINASPSGTTPNPFGTMAANNSSNLGNGGLGPRQMLAVLWDDNTPGAGGSIKWQLVSGNLVVQWTNEDHFNATGATVTYEMIVYAGRTIASGLPLVDYVYNDTLYAASQYQNDGGSATIGYKNWGVNASANDAEYGEGGGTNSLSDPAFADASRRPKVAGWVESGDSSLTHSVSIVPEPSSLALLALGVAALIRRR